MIIGSRRLWSKGDAMEGSVAFRGQEIRGSATRFKSPSNRSRWEQSTIERQMSACLTLRDEMLSKRLGDGLRSIANAELRLRLLKMTADRLRAQAERLGSVLRLRAGRHQP